MKTGSVIIGIAGHVVAIDPTTGSELWRTKLKGGDFVTTSVQNGRVYAGTKGELFCVDSHSGSILWNNKLKGLGLGLISFGTEQELAAAEKVVQQRRAAAAAAASS